MNPLKNGLMIIFITCLLFKRTMCNEKDLVLVAKTQIKFISNGTANATVNVGIPIMTVATHDPIKKDVYVSESYEESGRIFRIQTIEKTAYNVTPVVERQGWPVRGLAFHPIHSTLYWSTYGGIYYVHVSDDDSSIHLSGQLLLELDAQTPLSITIDVRNGYLYWVNSYTLKTTIDRSHLDGSKQRTLVEGLIDPRSITVDVETNTLYWTEFHQFYQRGSRKIHSMVNGNNHTLVHTTDEYNPIVIALVNRDIIYWIDSVSGKLWGMPKNSSSSPTLVSEDKLKDEAIGLFVMSNGNSMQAIQEDSEKYVHKSMNSFQSLKNNVKNMFKSKK